MTISQMHAVWELRRQGFPLTAEEAAARWERGEPYEPERQLHFTREIEQLMDRCNWETETQAKAA